MTVNAVVLRDITLEYKDAEDAWKKMYNLKAIPDLGYGSPDKVEVTDFDSKFKQYINGLSDPGDLTFEFWAMPKGATNSNQDAIDSFGDAVIEFRLTVARENTIYYLSGETSNMHSGGSPAAAGEIKMTLNMLTYIKDTLDTTYAVTYEVNSGTGTVTDSSSPYSPGSVVTILASTGITYADHTFLRWNTQADGLGQNYEPGDLFTIYSATTLYAVWVADE